MEVIYMQTTLNVRGMTCGHCESSVTGALERLDGVTSVEVNLGSDRKSVV